MFSAKVLDSTATLNNFREIGSTSFVPGSQFTVVLRLHNTQLDLRHIPPATAQVTIFLNKTDNTAESIAASILSDDRSILSFEVSEALSSELLGGSISFEIDVLGDGTNIQKGIVHGALAKIVEGSC